MIDLDDIQSLIVRPSQAEAVQITFLRLQSRRGMRQFLLDAAGCVTTASDAAAQSVRSQHLATVTVAVSAAGLDLAGLEPRARAALSPTFLSGMRSAAPRLGDVGESDPTQWLPPFDTNPLVHISLPIHAAVIVHGQLDTTRNEGVKDLLGTGFVKRENSPGDEQIWDGQRLGGYEPFGFRDSISDPAIEGSGKPMKAGNGVWDEAADRWRPVRAGEAILGYVDESGSIAGHADAAHVERNGSYLVVRKLEQDVEGFWDDCAAWADDLEIADPSVPSTGSTCPMSTDPSWARAVQERTTAAGAVAAQMVGRAWDGTPLGRTSAEDNDFLYRDPERSRGVVVSPSAHIRRANPRDGIAEARSLVPRHLLFRRGIPYFDRHTPGSEDGRTARGLLFLACCADLHRQFEFMQARWLQDGSRFGLGRERDPLTGTRSDQLEPPRNAPPPARDYPDLGELGGAAGNSIDQRVSIDDEGQRCRRPLPSYVHTRGGEYFLVPGRSALLLLGDAERSAG